MLLFGSLQYQERFCVTCQDLLHGRREITVSFLICKETLFYQGWNHAGSRSEGFLNLLAA